MAKNRKTAQLDVMSDVIKLVGTCRVDVGTSLPVRPGEQRVRTHMTAIVDARGSQQKVL